MNANASQHSVGQRVLQCVVGRLRLLSPMLCVTVLGACSSDTAQYRFDEYKTRLARSLKLDSTEVAVPVEPARRPRKRDLLLEESRSRITMLDFLRLNQCALGEVIGEQNSVLGKVAPASQRLLNDLDFLRLAPDCIAQLQEGQSNRLAETLAEAMNRKREGLTVSIANATLASDEFSGLWRVPVALGDFPVHDVNTSIDELRYVESEVARWLSGDYAHDSARFENALGTLRNGEAGFLVAAAVLTQAQLESANRLVKSRREGRPLCFNRKPGNQGRILRRVVDRFFIGEIQLWLSRVNALRYELLAAYMALEEHLNAAQSPAYRQWQEERDSQLAWLSSAPRQHVKIILPLLEICGVAPGD